MKKLIFIALAAFFSFVASAQGGQNSFKSSTNGGTVDTVTNAGTKTMVASMLTGSLNQTEISVTLTQISGTSAGNAILEHSADGVNYYSFVGDTLTFTAAGTKAFRYNIGATNKVRLRFVGTGTQSTKLQVFYKTR